MSDQPEVPESHEGGSEPMPETVVQPPAEDQNVEGDADASDAFGSDDAKEPELPPIFPDYTPHENVSLMSVFEEVVGSKTTEFPVEILNLSRDDLTAIRRRYYTQIAKVQPTRVAVVEANLTHDFITANLSDTIKVLVTETELNYMTFLKYQGDNLRKAAGYRLFENDSESLWTNAPKRGNDLIAIRNLNAVNSTDPKQRVRAKSGMSVECPVPLWNSGVHLKISSQGQMDILALQTQMAMDKSDSARESSGYTYSAMNVVVNQRISNFILEHTTDSTVGKLTPTEFMKLIKITDLEGMVLGATAACHPKGYPMTRTCLSSTGGCGHVVEGLIQPRRMLVVRESRVTEAQWTHMNRKAQKVDIKSVDEYQKSLRPEISRYVHVVDDVYLRLIVPSLYDYDRLAGAWMTALTDRARQLVPSNANEVERESFLSRATLVAQLMTYLPWYDAVVEWDPSSGNEPVVTEERQYNSTDPEKANAADAWLEEYISDMADYPERVERITLEVSKFVDNMSMSVCVVEKAPCPVCNKPLFGDSESKHKHAVQIDPVELFFTLHHLRLARATG